MEMPIDEIISILDDMKVKIDIPKAAVMQNNKNYALDVAIDTMRKYQKIEKLWAGFNNGEYDYAPFLRALKLIIESEEVEDGK